MIKNNLFRDTKKGFQTNLDQFEYLLDMVLKKTIDLRKFLLPKRLHIGLFHLVYKKEINKLSQLVTESSIVKQLVSQIPWGIVYAVSTQLRDEYQRMFKIQNIDWGLLS